MNTVLSFVLKRKEDLSSFCDLLRAYPLFMLCLGGTFFVHTYMVARLIPEALWLSLWVVGLGVSWWASFKRMHAVMHHDKGMGLLSQFFGGMALGALITALYIAVVMCMIIFGSQTQIVHANLMQAILLGGVYILTPALVMGLFIGGSEPSAHKESA